MGLASELPPGERDGVEGAVGLEQPGHLDAVLEPQAPRHAVGHVELGRHRGPLAYGVAHGADDLAGEAGPVLDAASPLVAAPVELRAQERAQQVVVAQVDLDAVEAGVDHGLRRAPVVGGDAGDLGLGDLAAHGAEGADVPRRGEGRSPVRPGVGHGAGMAELGGHGRAGVVHGVGEPAQAREHVVAHHDAVTVGASFGRDGQVGDGGHGRAALAHAAVEVDEGVGDLSLRGRALEGRRLDEAVAEGERPESGGLERRTVDGGGPGCADRPPGRSRVGGDLEPVPHAPHRGDDGRATRGRPRRGCAGA